MAKTYRVTGAARLVNRILVAMVRRGVGPKYRYVLTVAGRRSRTPRSVPVDVMAENGSRWLVAAYGVTNWVRNVRAAGTAALMRGGRDERVRLIELPPAEAIPVLRMYLERVAIVRRYFDVTASSSDEDFAPVAATHPVFRTEPVAAGGRAG